MVNNALRQRSRYEVAHAARPYEEDEPYYKPKTPQFKPHDLNPSWLTKGMQQFVDLIDEDGSIRPRDPGEPFDHLATQVAGLDPNQHLGVRDYAYRSDLLHIPESEKVGRVALRGGVFVVNANFRPRVGWHADFYGNGDSVDRVFEPKLDIVVNRYVGKIQKRAIAASESGEPVLLRAPCYRVGDEERLIRISSGSQEHKDPREVPKGKPLLSRVRPEGFWSEPDIEEYPEDFAMGLLKILLAPKLNKRVKRIGVRGSLR